MGSKLFFIRTTLAAFFAAIGLAGYSQAVQVRNDSGVPLTSQDEIVNKYSQLLQVPKDSIKNIQLYTLIEQYSGAPYKYGGNDPKGVDCSGFSCVIEQQVYGITIPRSTTTQASAAKTKNVSDLKEGDLVFLHLGGTKVNHVGVYLQNGYFVHATSNLGIVLDNMSHPDTQARFISCGSAK